MSIESRQSRWTTAEPQGVTFVELFFDLVFVYAVTQITSLLHANLTLIGTGRSLLILWLVWWAWTQFTWTLNPADTTDNAVRLITLTAVGAAFFMAQAVPDAFNGGEVWFAVAYVIVRILGLAIQIEATLGTEYFTGAMTWTLLSSIGLVAVLVGALLPSPYREILWTMAVILDVLSASRAGNRRWSIDAAHFAERHGLIIIIALGESLIAAGVAVADAPRNLVFAVSGLGAVGLISAAWWIYFGSTREIALKALERTNDLERGAMARDMYSLGHLPLVGGIIAIAVALEEVLAHPEEPLGLSVLGALAGGTVLYVGGVAWVRQHADRRSMGPAGMLLAVVVGVLAVSYQSRGLVTLAAVAAVLVGYAFMSNLGHARD